MACFVSSLSFGQFLDYVFLGFIYYFKRSGCFQGNGRTPSPDVLDAFGLSLELVFHELIVEQTSIKILMKLVNWFEMLFVDRVWEKGPYRAFKKKRVITTVGKSRL